MWCDGEANRLEKAQVVDKFGEWRQHDLPPSLHSAYFCSLRFHRQSMKIHKIILKDYQQFKDLEIDLTYPAGHEKAGQPLDKVCFIGQSGTGKTTLLRLVKYFVTQDSRVSPFSKLHQPDSMKVLMILGIDKQEYFLVYNPKKRNFEIAGNPQKDALADWKMAIENAIKKGKPFCINFPAEKHDAARFAKKAAAKSSNGGTDELASKMRLVVDFAIEDESEPWALVLRDIKDHLFKQLEWKTKIADIVLKQNSKPIDWEMANNQYQKWLIENPSRLEFLAKKVEALIRPFGLCVRTEVDAEEILNFNDIPMQTLDGHPIARDFWSTGTKQIIDVAVPLVELSPIDTILLIDEPEKSLYPDIQSKIINFYTSLTTDCQFFYATHSPIIASSFDPWEIVELKFDADNRYVVQETNFEGKERHVKNYKVFPKYLRWDRILMNLFDLKEEGNSKERDKALLETISLRAELNDMKASGKTKGKAYQEKVERFLQLCKMVGWDEKTQ